MNDALLTRCCQMNLSHPVSLLLQHHKKLYVHGERDEIIHYGIPGWDRPAPKYQPTLWNKQKIRENTGKNDGRLLRIYIQALIKVGFKNVTPLHYCWRGVTFSNPTFIKACIYAGVCHRSFLYFANFLFVPAEGGLVFGCWPVPSWYAVMNDLVSLSVHI